MKLTLALLEVIAATVAALILGGSIGLSMIYLFH
jgi:hypothetical protein